MELALFFSKRSMRREIFYILLAFGTSIHAAEKIDLDKDVKVFTSSDKKAVVYEFSVPSDKSDKPRIAAIRLRVEEERITGFDLEWKNISDKDKKASIISRRELDPDFTGLQKSLGLRANADQATTPSQRYFKVKTSETLLSKLPAEKVNSAEKQDLKKEWDKYFFGVEKTDSNIVATTGSSDTKKLEDVISKLTDSSKNNLAEHNSYVLKEINDRATDIARGVNAYGPKLQSNTVVIESFPSRTSYQNFSAPNYYVDSKEGMEDEKAPSTATEKPQPKKKQR